MVARIAHDVVLSGQAGERTVQRVKRSRTLSIGQGMLTSAIIQVRGTPSGPARSSMWNERTRRSNDGGSSTRNFSLGGPRS